MRALAIAIALVLGLGATACHSGDPADANLKAAQGFLAANGRQPGVVTLPSGLEYKVVRSGPAGRQDQGQDGERRAHRGPPLRPSAADSPCPGGRP